MIINWIYLTGGLDKDLVDHASILEFSDSEEEGKWTIVGEMAQPRSYQGVSIVDMSNFKNHCQ